MLYLIHILLNNDYNLGKHCAKGLYFINNLHTTEYTLIDNNKTIMMNDLFYAQVHYLFYKFMLDDFNGK